MKRKMTIERDPEICYKSAVIGLQLAYDDYVRAIHKWFQNTGINADGKIFVASGYEDRAKHIQQCADEVKRMFVEVEHYRQFVKEGIEK